MDQLDDDTRQLVLARARRPRVPAPPGAPHDELPDVEAAWNRFQAWRTEEQKRWASTKQRAPYVPPAGFPPMRCPTPAPATKPGWTAHARSARERAVGRPDAGRGRQQGDPQVSTSALTISGALKQAWTDEELQKQFEDRNSPLSRWNGPRHHDRIAGAGRHHPRPRRLVHVRRRRRRRTQPGNRPARRAGHVHHAVLVVPDRARDVGAGADRQQRAGRRRRQGPRDPGRRREHPPSDQPADRDQRRRHRRRRGHGRRGRHRPARRQGGGGRAVRLQRPAAWLAARGRQRPASTSTSAPPPTPTR
jgi:hypothetical protein